MTHTPDSVRETLAELAKTAREVYRRGAEVGKQWLPLGAALTKAERALAETTEESSGGQGRVEAKQALIDLAAYFRRIGGLWEGPDGCGTPGTDLCEKIAAQCIEKLVKKHGGVRAAVRSAGIDAGYLTRLRNGERDAPSDAMLEALGIERVVTYRLRGNQSYYAKE